MSAPRRFRVAVVTRFPAQPGGTAARAYWSAHAQARRGHSVFVVTDAPEAPSAPPREAEGELKVFRAQDFDPAVSRLQAEPRLERLAGMLCDVVETHDCDLIDARFLVPYAVAGFIAGNLSGRPVVLRHAITDLVRLWPSPALKPILDRVIRASAGVLTVAGRFPHFEQVGVPRSRLHIAHYGVDHTAFHPEAVPLELAERVDDLPAGVPVLLHESKLSGDADTERVLLGLSTLRTDDFILLVVVPPGAGRERIWDTAARFGMEESLRFIDPVMPWEMPGLLRACRATIFPAHGSRTKHRSHLVRESFAAGTPVVLSDEAAADLGDWLEQEVVHDQTAVCYEAGEAGELAAAVRSLLRRPTGDIDAIAERARAYSLATEDAERVAREEEAVFGRILDANEVRRPPPLPG